MRRLRATLFALIFYGVSVPIVLGAPVAGLLGRPAMRGWVRMWARWHRWCARALLGVRVRVEGAPPAHPLLIVAKHEAMFETIEVVLMLHEPVVVMKRELADIPIWGWCARRYGMIVIDREGSARTLRQMVREAKAAVEAGRAIVLFPEGTRVPHGEAPPLRSGMAGLYRALGLPAMPLAVDSGRFIPREGLPRPGTITFRFGEELPPGLPRAEAEARIHAAINVLNGGQ
ncbi:1-acyl-sn-glycerol-3-phosphate acyltransferase [Sphingomonas gilva]|uniref:1-acyl-sn-glycerol-3-phosphate acyltransferase n=1 Tax=Sphingomonas gilva TaxID=2305907 RepID=A0A396RQF1_9SPHN|nr:lysophospholipid acyltransferase family protein [Sphingomonas gilva]RHW18609.1 1-acyl-sn-glycerol-3-phosphate acyltransferase [Sphingomonas gilva]